MSTCPHCGHEWSRHNQQVGEKQRCDCGCMWTDPATIPPPPPPPTTRQQVVERIRQAIFDELDRQHEAGEIDAAGYWDREWGRCDGEPDWTQVAAAALSVVVDGEPDEVLYALMQEVGWW